MDDLNYREILVRKPFYEVQPRGYMQHRVAYSAAHDTLNAPDDFVWRKIKTQADFLREYYPSAHIIFDEVIYPDIYKQDPETKKWFIQPITRTAFAFQQLIAVKHLLHVTGNDVQFEIADSSCDEGMEEQRQRTLVDFKRGWLLAHMEMHFFDAVRSLMVTGDGAIVGFFDKDGHFGARTLSFMDNDTLYPHFDSITGELKLFARRYYDYDEEGTKTTEWVEVWDDTYLYRYRKGSGKGEALLAKIKEIFGMSGYELVLKERHGFNFVPVAYVRNDDGACWSMVQRNIEDYEEAYSYLCENNKAFAFPIMYFKGDGIDVKGDTNGAAKVIAMSDTDSEAGFLNGTDASNAFATQLNKSYDLIYELSFTVKPPELKSGDLPGVAIKLLYSPALEMAMVDAQRLQPFVNTLVKIAKFGIGYENNCTATMVNLPVNAWIEPYIHSNQTEVITNLASAVQNKFLSRQTASERCPDFPKNDEFERIVREEKEKQEQDLLNDIALQDNQTQNAIEQEEAAAAIQQQDGQDVNTGHGKKAGRPNKSGKTWDSNGNFLGESNWDTIDQYKKN